VSFLYKCLRNTLTYLLTVTHTHSHTYSALFHLAYLFSSSGDCPIVMYSTALDSSDNLPSFPHDTVISTHNEQFLQVYKRLLV